MRAFASFTLVGGLFLLIGVAACGEYPVHLIPKCYDEDDGHRVPCCGEWPDVHPCSADAGADGDVDGGTTDASDDGDADPSADDGGPPAAVCPWGCTPVGGGGFDPFPSYVWFEKDGKPEPPPLNGFPWTSWMDVKFAEPNCPPCSCVAPTNSVDGCVLPTVWSVESTVCQDPSSGTVTIFDSPMDWTGSCTSANPIEAGVLCDGEPCVKSLVVQPPSIAPCAAEPMMPPEGQTLPPPEAKKVIEYVAAATGAACNSEGTKHCIVPPRDGYKLCFVARNADAVAPCPQGWTDRYAGWREVSDTRVCTPCSCGSPEGASCIVQVKSYADDACMSEAGSLLVSSNEGEKCVDLLVGTALGSKTADVLSYQEGVCVASTSEIIGEAKTERAVTYCCVPDVGIPP